MMLIHWEEAYILHRIRTGALVVASNENGTAVNASKTKYKVVSRDRNEDEVTI